MRKPTLKQRRFILAYIDNGGNATQAALAAYDTTYATARVIGCENLTKPNIKRVIDSLMEVVELSTKDSLRAIKDALNAMDRTNHPDHRMRLNAAVLALKLKGAYPRNRQTHQHPPQQHVHHRKPLDVIMESLKNEFND